MALSAQPSIRESSLRQQALDELRRSVLSGRFQPGERLSEVETAASLGASRGPLREALRYLGSEGLISLVEHRGAFVPTFTAERLAQLYEVRIALESMAARIAAMRGSAADIDDLRHILEETAGALNGFGDVAYVRVFEALADGNPDAAEGAMREHLESSLHSATCLFQASDDAPADPDAVPTAGGTLP